MANSRKVPKTRKVQVTLEEAQYSTLEQIAARDGKKLAAVVRESIERYCIAPENRRLKREALDDLLSVAAPPPDDYGAWKEDYARLKASGGLSGEETPEPRD